MNDAFETEEKENFAVQIIELLNNVSEMSPIYS